MGEKPFGFDHHDIKVDCMVQQLLEKYKAIMRLAMLGHLTDRPGSVGRDVLAGIVQKRAGCDSYQVDAYSLCRLPSVITDSQTQISDPSRPHSTTQGKPPSFDREAADRLLRGIDEVASGKPSRT